MRSTLLMKKILVWGISSLFLIIYSTILITKQSFSIEINEDLQPSYKMECLMPPSDTGVGKGLGLIDLPFFLIPGVPPKSETFTLNGTCSSPSGCDLTLCVIPELKPLQGAGNLDTATLKDALSKINIDHSNEKCTTGNSQKDMYYFGQDYTNITQASFTAQSLNEGKINNLEVTLNNPKHMEGYDFYATGKTGGTGLPTTTPDPTLTIPINQSQQLGIIIPPAISITLAPGEKANCESIFWDPYGRVFDGVSLEPLNTGEAKVTLLNKDNSIVNIPVNNVSIDRLGKYNILIKDDGEYKLSASPLTSHQFINFIPDPKYKDLYETIFMPGDSAFFESAKDPKRVDIALKPISTPYLRQIDVVQNDYKQVWVNGKKYIRVELRVTHPRSLVKLIVNDIIVKDNGEGKALPAEADKSGYWKILVRDYKVLSQKGFRVEVSKNPKYYPNAGQPGNKTIINFDPILPYVEGYAYDDSGKIIPNAKVQIKLKMNDSVFYETKTDATGYFAIQSTSLPPLDYYFVFIDMAKNSSIRKTTAEFVADNTTYLETEKIDLLKGEKNGELVSRSVDQRKADSYFGSSNNGSNNKNNDSNNISSALKNSISFKIFLIVFILIILVFASLGIILYIKKS